MKILSTEKMNSLLYFLRLKKPVRKLTAREELRRRILEAKAKIDVTIIVSSTTGYFVENYDEVRLILGYEDTLAMQDFVRDYIARNVETELCIEKLLPSFQEIWDGE